jgi:hypothetical protein
MRVMPFRHAGVRMTEVRGDYRKRGASLQKVCSVGVAQNVKTSWRVYSRVSASFAKTTVLVRRPPWSTIWTSEDQRSGGFAGCVDSEQSDTIIGEHDVSWSTSLTGTYADCSRTTIEVGNFECHDFAVPASRQQRALDQRTKSWGACIYQPLRFGVAEISNFRYVRFAKRLHASPRIVGFHLAFAVREI